MRLFVLITTYMCSFNNNDNMREKFQYFRGDYEAIFNDLDAIDWDNVLDDQSVDEMWNTFKSKLYDSMEQYIPKKSSNNKFMNPPLWMDGKTKVAILKKHRAWKKYSYARSRENYRKYASERNKCTHTIRDSKKSYERKIATEAKKIPKSFWKYVNSKLKTKTGVGSLEEADGTLVYEDVDKVEALNNYFSSVFTRTDDLNEPIETREMDSLLSDISVTSEEVLKKLSYLNTDKSAGPDNLHPKVLFSLKFVIK